MRTLLISILLIIGSAYGQKVTVWSATRSSGITDMVFDENNNRYIYGYYKGAPQFSSQLPKADKSQNYLAKLTPNNIVQWVVPTTKDRSRFEMLMHDNQIVFMAWQRDRDKTNNTYLRALYLETYDLKGHKLVDKEILKTTNKDIAMLPHLSDHGIATESVFKGDENSFKINDKTYSKKKYGSAVFHLFDFSGQMKWEYQIEGGFNNFTDIRPHDLTCDKNGNTYITGYFSESLDLGISQMTTQLRFEGPIDLYDNAAFLLKIDANGKAIKGVKMADHTFETEKILVDDEENLYLSAYYKGNDAYEKEQGNPGNYMVARFFGVPLPDAMAKAGSGDEEQLIAKLDKDLNVVWKQFVYGIGYNRARSMELREGTLYVCGTANRETHFGKDKKIVFSDEGYSDTYYADLDASTGEFKNVKSFVADHSNSGNVHIDNAGNVVVTGSFRNPINIDGKTYQQVGSVTTSYIYDFNAQPTSSGSNGSSNKSNNSSTTTAVSTTTSTASTGFNIGDRVMANWLYKGKYWPGKITRVGGGKYYVEYDDSGVEWCKLDQLVKESDYKKNGGAVTKTRNNSEDELKVGDRVKGNWLGKGTYYSGKIGKISGGRYFIQYDDGDTEWTTADKLKRE